MSKHHNLELSSPWDHHEPADVRAWFAQSNDDPEIARRMYGRAVLNIGSGPFDLHLRPTAPELRALAAMLCAVADELDGCTHLQGVV